MKTFLGDTEVTIEYSDATHTLTIKGARPLPSPQGQKTFTLFMAQGEDVETELVLMNPEWTKNGDPCLT